MAIKTLNGYNIVDTSAGQANGIATLTSERKVPASQLPAPFGCDLFTARDYEVNISTWVQAIKNGAYRPTTWFSLGFTNIIACLKIDATHYFIVRSRACAIYDTATETEQVTELPNFRECLYAVTYGEQWLIYGVQRSGGAQCVWVSTDKGQTWTQYQQTSGTDPYNTKLLCTDQYCLSFYSYGYSNNPCYLFDVEGIRTSFSVRQAGSICVGDTLQELFSVAYGNYSTSTVTGHAYHYIDSVSTDITPPMFTSKEQALSVAYFKGILTLASNKGFYRSYDKGISWTKTSSSGIQTNASDWQYTLALPDICYWLYKQDDSTAKVVASRNGEDWLTVLSIPISAVYAMRSALCQQHGLVFLCLTTKLYLLEGLTAILMTDWTGSWYKSLCFSLDTYTIGTDGNTDLNCRPEPLYIN